MAVCKLKVPQLLSYFKTCRAEKRSPFADEWDFDRNGESGGEKVMPSRFGAEWDFEQNASEEKRIPTRFGNEWNFEQGASEESGGAFLGGGGGYQQGGGGYQDGGGRRLSRREEKRMKRDA